MNKDLIPLLQSGLDQLNLELTDKVQEKIILYIELLHKWNKIHNLTAIREQKEILINTFENWRGNLEQIDDIVILGVKI